MKPMKLKRVWRRPPSGWRETLASLGPSLLVAALALVLVAFKWRAAWRDLPTAPPVPPLMDPPPTQRVPRVVHQTGPDVLPEHWRGAPEMWARTNPGLEYRFWSDRDARELIRQDFPWFLEVYDGYPDKIQRADAMRYFVLYKHGGLYIDLDIQPLMNVETLFQRLERNAQAETMIAETPNIGLTNAFMMAVPKSKLMDHVIHGLEAKKDPLVGYFLHHFRVLLSTGPTMLWWTTEDYLKEHPGEVERLPAPVWGKCLQCARACPVTDNSRFRHVTGESWTRMDTAMINFAFLCHPQECLLAILALVVLLAHWRGWLSFPKPKPLAAFMAVCLAAMLLAG